MNFQQEPRTRSQKSELKTLQKFSFEVIKVNSQGKEINCCCHEAEFFTENLDRDVVLEMVYIPGGSFLMGSPEDEAERNSDESPQHQVTL
jgi:formylglycine-generating enzyme required for sulfatase activity